MWTIAHHPQELSVIVIAAWTGLWLGCCALRWVAPGSSAYSPFGSDLSVQDVRSYGQTQYTRRTLQPKWKNAIMVFIAGCETLFWTLQIGRYLALGVWQALCSSVMAFSWLVIVASLGLRPPQVRLKSLRLFMSKELVCRLLLMVF